jgi:hypothetical protein
LAEINFVDGQTLAPTTFGQYNEFGVWSPRKYGGSYGTNGFYLPFNDPTSATTLCYDRQLGYTDTSKNNWTPNNISTTAGTTYDAMTDVPPPSTIQNVAAGNYAVANPLSVNSATITDGNLGVSISGVASAVATAAGTIGVSSGKWYWETTVISNTTSDLMIGVVDITRAATARNYSNANTWYYYGANGNKYISGTGSAYGASYTNNNVIGIALDMDNGTIVFYKDGASQGTAASTGISGLTIVPVWGNGTSGGAQVYAANFGQRPFSYTPPSGFRPLNTNNLPAPTIPNGAKVMAATLYTGNGSSQSISNSANNTLGVTFQPDLVWQKARSAATDHIVYDTPRASNYLVTNTTAAEVASGIVALTSTGFNVGSGTAINANGTTYVGWQWNAGSGVTSTNTDGTVTGTVTTCVNKSAGFSVVTFTSSSPCTVGHGLGVAPSFIILKSRNNASGWSVYHSSVGNTGALNLQATTATSTSIDWWSNTSPTSLVFSIGANIINSWTWVAYCWTPIAGYSSFGSFTGNGSADGPMIFTNMRPRYLFIKRTDSAGTSWWQVDSSCNPYNVTSGGIELNTSSAESSGNTWCDFLSNGFKIRTTSVGVNASGGTYIYAAFAENPFKLALAR